MRSDPRWLASLAIVAVLTFAAAPETGVRASILVHTVGLLFGVAALL